MKTKEKKIKISALISSGCTHTTIAADTVQREKLPTEKMKTTMEIYNLDGTRNRYGKIKEVVPIALEAGGHTEQINAVVSGITEMDIFLGYDWLEKYNPEIDWKKGTISFTRYPKNCHLAGQTTTFNNQRALIYTDEPTEDKEPDKTEELDLPKYIRPFTHLFNKKKFEVVPQTRKWDHKINLAEQAPGELNTKAYAMTIKEEETLNEWLDEQLKAGLIVESSSKYAWPCFFIPKKNRTLWLVQDYQKLNCKDLSAKRLKVLLDVRVDKENSLESSFIWSIYLYTILLVYALLSCTFM